jgi:hypothetical protein
MADELDSGGGDDAEPTSDVEGELVRAGGLAEA